MKSLITDTDCYLFNEGKHFLLHDKLGCHLDSDGQGAYFAVWAPNAEAVSVIGDFNDWQKGKNPMKKRGETGIFELYLEGVKKGNLYKYFIQSKWNGYRVDKADPFGIKHQLPPNRASVAWDLNYEWQDQAWMGKRAEKETLNGPMTIYEVHLGSWRRKGEQGKDFLSYEELTEFLVPYVVEMGFTHVEFMPPMAHPLYDSWGYQVTGHFAATSRYGDPQGLMKLIDAFHQENIGVIIDWVPSHFPTDEHGLQYFDGTHLFEHEDPRQGFHPDWKSSVFNYSRHEVVSFLVSSAAFWLDKFHADALRVDAVASMLYLDYSRKEGEWVANKYGGRENVEAIEFLRNLNQFVYQNFPGVQMIAEESTAWPLVSRPPDVGGLGFGFKWNMGWMHDTLKYFQKDPYFRSHHQNDLTFSSLYAFSENFILPFSHDEVVHGKGSLLGKMPGDRFQKFANLRLLLGLQYTHPGKKLLFMGAEIGQFSEWNNNQSLDWHLLQHPEHQGIQEYVKALNYLYQNLRPLYEQDFESEGFQWIDCNDYQNSVISFRRRAKDGEEVVVILNFTPVVHEGYRVGLPEGGKWKEIFNSDDQHFAGSGVVNNRDQGAESIPMHGLGNSFLLTLPPLGVSIWKRC